MTTPERRRFRRARAPIAVRPVGVITSARPRNVNDVSLGGLRSYSDDAYQPGERLELELLFEAGDSATVLVDVIWVERLAEGAPARFDVGMRFVEAVPADLERIAAVLEG